MSADFDADTPGAAKSARIPWGRETARIPGAAKSARIPWGPSRIPTSTSTAWKAGGCVLVNGVAAGHGVPSDAQDVCDEDFEAWPHARAGLGSSARHRLVDEWLLSRVESIHAWVWFVSRDEWRSRERKQMHATRCENDQRDVR